MKPEIQKKYNDAKETVENYILPITTSEELFRIEESIRIDEKKEIIQQIISYLDIQIKGINIELDNWKDTLKASKLDAKIETLEQVKNWILENFKE